MANINGPKGYQSIRGCIDSAVRGLPFHGRLLVGLDNLLGEAASSSTYIARAFAIPSLPADVNGTYKNRYLANGERLHVSLREFESCESRHGHVR
jgi:hypothetical protein